MKEKIKVGEKWVYIKCSKCGKKKDFAKDKFDKKLDGKTPEEFAETFVCSTCSKDKQKPTATIENKGKSEIREDYRPYTKERQLGKKEKKTFENKFYSK